MENLCVCRGTAPSHVPYCEHYEKQLTESCVLLNISNINGKKQGKGHSHTLLEIFFSQSLDIFLELCNVWLRHAVRDGDLSHKTWTQVMKMLFFCDLRWTLVMEHL